jgi:hypothetical protein
MALSDADSLATGLCGGNANVVSRQVAEFQGSNASKMRVLEIAKAVQNDSQRKSSQLKST